MTARVYLVAAEASGDALGADLVHALRAARPDLEISGVGGEAMAAAGVASAIDLKGLAVLGFVDGLKAYPRVVRLADAVAEDVAAKSPGAVVLIDSWGFMLRVAQRVRARGLSARLVKYIGPQVFATRAGRARTLAATVDHLICIHDFEPPYYTPFGLACTVCGHPAIGRHRAGDGAAWRAREGFAANARILLVLPGSRSSEIRRTGPILFDAAAALQRETPDVSIVVLASSAVEAAVRALAAQRCPEARIITEGADKPDVFAGATAALATSGTVTTEVALHETPVVVGYRLGWVTWALARAFLFKARWMTLMNIAAQDEVAPEFIQTRCTARNLMAAVRPLLNDPNARRQQVAAQSAALQRMGRGGRPAAEIAAEAVLAELDRQPRPEIGT